ncbi:MAG: hypothetical protein J6B39_05525, partial [Lachnospiraceae bacterium]|nr:hypothetical protein [Lachnospiraceae bacterium]
VIGKKVADFALVTYVENLLIDEDQSKELIELLDEKYKVKSQKGIEFIIDRIKDGLGGKYGVQQREDSF